MLRQKALALGRMDAGFGVLTEKTNESDVIFAKHVFVFLSCPDWSGRHRTEGAALQASEGCFFGASGGDCLCSCKSRSGQSVRETETRRAGTAERRRLPWGQDHLVPIFLATLAVRQQSRKVTFTSAADMLETFGMQQGGSQYRRLVAEFQRSFGATIFFGTDHSRCGPTFFNTPALIHERGSNLVLSPTG